MDKNERNILLNELNNIPKNLESRVLIDGYYDSLYTLLSDPVKSKKALIDNKFGVFGNLFYKFKDDIDITLTKEFILHDFNIMHEMYYLDDCDNFSCSHPLMKEIVKDKDFMLRLARMQPYVAYAISDEVMRKDKMFVLTCLDYSNYDSSKDCFHINIELNDCIDRDKDILCSLFKKDSSYIFNVDREVFFDRDIALTAVRYCPESLYIFPDVMKNDKNIVETAVIRNGEALNYASDNLKEDKEFILDLYQKNWKIFEHYKPSFYRDRDFLTKLLSFHPPALLDEDDDIRKDIDFIISVAKKKVRVVVDVSVYEKINSMYGKKYNKFIINYDDYLAIPIDW